MELQSAGHPPRPITLVVPLTPGSGPDVLANGRAPALRAACSSRCALIVRAAGTNIGTASVARLHRTAIRCCSARSPTPSIRTSCGPSAIAWRISRPFPALRQRPTFLSFTRLPTRKRVKELIALLKSKPGTPAGHAGIGTTPHLSLEIFRRAAGIEVTMVPLQGRRAGAAGILGDEVPFMFSTSIGVLPLVRTANCVRSPSRVQSASAQPQTFRRSPNQACLALMSSPGSGCSHRPARRRRLSTGSAPRHAPPWVHPKLRKLLDECWRRAARQHARSICQIYQGGIRPLGQGDQRKPASRSTSNDCDQRWSSRRRKLAGSFP